MKSGTDVYCPRHAKGNWDKVSRRINKLDSSDDVKTSSKSRIQDVVARLMSRIPHNRLDCEN